jgi:hypothetical protein
MEQLSLDQRLMVADRRLEKWHYLQDCLLEDIHLVHHGSSLELRFNYIWIEYGKRVRSDKDSPLYVNVRCHLVHYLWFVGGLTASMIREPERINWGLSEIEIVKVAGPDMFSQGMRQPAIPRDVLVLVCCAAGGRRWEIVCSDIDVDPPYPGD